MSTAREIARDGRIQIGAIRSRGDNSLVSALEDLANLIEYRLDLSSWETNLEETMNIREPGANTDFIQATAVDEALAIGKWATTTVPC